MMEHPVERRQFSRVACHLELYDDDGRRFELRDFTPEGMRLFGAPFDGPRAMNLGVAGEHLRFTATCVRAIPQRETHELGIVVSGDRDVISRLGFLAAAIAHRPPENVRWMPFMLAPRPGDAKATVDALRSVALPSRSAEAAGATEVVHRRNDFVWKWGYEAIRACTIGCVPREHRELAIDLKLAYAVLTTMIDDAVDLLRDREAFDLLRGRVLVDSPHDNVPEAYRPAAECWHRLMQELRTLPSSQLISPWFRFDHETVAHSMTYALLVNSSPDAYNRAELHTWNVHSFYILPFADIDLMFAKRLRSKELGPIREILNHAQNMCAIANWLGTWEREFRERDLSSGVVSTALERQIFTIAEIDEPTEAIQLVRQAHVEEYWMAQWEKHWEAIDLLPPISSFDKDSYLRGLERVYQLQMIGRGKL